MLFYTVCTVYTIYTVRVLVASVNSTHNCWLLVFVRFKKNVIHFS